eukprot:gene108-719_t
MAHPVVQFIGKELGKHGTNIYYKEFSVHNNGEKRSFKLGEFYFVRKDPSQPICIAEFQLIWLNVKYGKKLAVVKLYFRPEDTKTGRLVEHGDDELVEADRHVPVYCDQVPSWECIPDVEFGKYAYEGLDANDFITNHKGQIDEPLCCRCPVSNGHIAGNRRLPVRILSFSAYCRYRACASMFASDRKLRKELMAARGAIEVDCCHTKILFCRFKFQHPDINDFALADDIRVPVFKGRPRKRKQIRVRNANMKKCRLEKENSKPDTNVNQSIALAKSTAANGIRSQTYKIIPSPAKKNTDRNIIHMKLETNNIPESTHENRLYFATNQPVVGKSENSQDFGSNDRVDGGLKGRIPPIVERNCSEVRKGVDSDKTDENCEITGNEMLKKETADGPSELVKKGKTGTVLDESIFREMKVGPEVKPGDGMDKDHIKMILQEVSSDIDKFKSNLYMFMKQRGTPISYVPKVGYTRVDLPKLFQLVILNGGYKQVTLNHKWKKIYDEMVLATTITSAATCMRRHYERLLLPFEKHLRLKHRQDAPLKTYSVTSQISQPLVLTIKTIKQKEEQATQGGLQKSVAETINTTSSAAATEIGCQNQNLSTPVFPVKASSPEICRKENQNHDSSKLSGSHYPSATSVSCVESIALSSEPTVSLQAVTSCVNAVSNCPLDTKETFLTISGPYKSRTSQPKHFATTNDTLLTSNQTHHRSSTLAPEKLQHDESFDGKHLNSAETLSAAAQRLPLISDSGKESFQAHHDTVKEIQSVVTSSMSQAFQQPPRSESTFVEFNAVTAATVNSLSSTKGVVSNSDDAVKQQGVLVIAKGNTQNNQPKIDAMPRSATDAFPMTSNGNSIAMLTNGRGRPSKSARSRVQQDRSALVPVNYAPQKSIAKHGVVTSSIAAPVFNRVVVSNSGAKPIANSSVMSTLHMQTALPANGFAQKQARNTTDSALRKAMVKTAPVKMYEYVMKTDAEQAKLVKQKQSVITLAPRTSNMQLTPSSAYVTAYAENAPLVGLTVGDRYPTTKQDAIGFSNDASVCGSFPTTTHRDSCYDIAAVSNRSVDTDNMFAYGRHVASNNANDRIQWERKDLELNRSTSSDAAMNVKSEPRAVPVKELPDIDLIEKSTVMIANVKDSCLAKSVIVGPPPLVPIAKSNDPGVTSKTLVSQDSIGHSAIRDANIRSSSKDSTSKLKDVTDAVLMSNRMMTGNGVRHISLKPDYQSMKESLDANSLMKPLSKEIDDSLEDLRKVVGANIYRNIKLMSDESYDLTEQGSKFQYAHASDLAHEDRMIVEGQERCAAYEQLKVPADPYRYHAPSHNVDYRQSCVDDDINDCIGRLYDGRIHPHHSVMSVSLESGRDTNRLGLAPLQKDRMRQQQQRDSHDNQSHHQHQSQSSGTEHALHRQSVSPSSLQVYGDRSNYQILYDPQQHFKSVDRPKAIYEQRLNNEQYNELYHHHANYGQHHAHHITNSPHVQQQQQQLLSNEEALLVNEAVHRHHGRRAHNTSDRESIDSAYNNKDATPLNTYKEMRESNFREARKGDEILRDNDAACLPHSLYLDGRERCDGDMRSRKDFDLHRGGDYRCIFPTYNLPGHLQQHEIDHHHEMASAYSNRVVSPLSFEHKHLMMPAHSPPSVASTMHHSWYHQAMPADNALYWHTKVHH